MYIIISYLTQSLIIRYLLGLVLELSRRSYGSTIGISSRIYTIIVNTKSIFHTLFVDLVIINFLHFFQLYIV